MLALALEARNDLLQCGPVVFRHGSTDCIRAFTSGMNSLVELSKRLTVMGSQSDALALPARKSQQPQDVAFGQARLSPTMRIGRGGSYYNLAQLMKFLNVTVHLRDASALKKTVEATLQLLFEDYSSVKLPHSSTMSRARRKVDLSMMFMRRLEWEQTGFQPISVQLSVPCLTRVHLERCRI